MQTAFEQRILQSCVTGDFEELKTCDGNKDLPIDSRLWERCVANILTYKHFLLLKYILENKYVHIHKVRHCLFVFAKNVDEMRCIIEIAKKQDYVFDIYNMEIVEHCCKKGYIESAKYLLDLSVSWGKPYIIKIECLESCLSLQLLETVFSYIQKQNLSLDIETILMFVISSGNVNMAKYVVSFANIHTLHSNISLLFIHKVLYSLSKCCSIEMLNYLIKATILSKENVVSYSSEFLSMSLGFNLGTKNTNAVLLFIKHLADNYGKFNPTFPYNRNEDNPIPNQYGYNTILSASILNNDEIMDYLLDTFPKWDVSTNNSRAYFHHYLIY